MFKEQVRAANPIEEIIAESIQLKNSVGLCPFHEDTTPSLKIYPTTQSWFCFGCGKGGDVFDYIMLKENLDFAAALNHLANRAGITPPKWTPEQQQQADERQREIKSLTAKIDKYHQDLPPEHAAYKSLLSRGITPETINQYRLGFESGSGHVIIPIFRHGKLPYIIRWSPNKKPKYLFPESQEKPLIGSEFLGVDGCLTVEGFFDWLSLRQAGYPAVCTLGTQLSESQLKELEHTPTPIIMFDADAAGRKASEKLAEQLLNSRIATLPDSADPNELLIKAGDGFKATMDKIINEAKSLLDRRLDVLTTLDIKSKYARDNVFPIVAKLDPLEKEIYEKKLKTILKVKTATIAKAVNETITPEPEVKEEISKETIEAGHVFAKSLSNQPLNEVAAVVKSSGLMGETNNVKLIYLALTSRLLNKPVSEVLKGTSSGGKSWTVEKVLDLFPSGAYWARTGLSPHALAYSDEDFSHRTLVIFEACGLGDEGDYLLRSLLSEGRLIYETVESTPTGIKSKLIEKPGPTNCIITTTAVKLHPENETRLLSLSVDDSKEQTAAVLMHTVAPPKPVNVSGWQAFQTWLSVQDNAVVIPYAEPLAAAIPPIAVRLRRDFNQLISLIKTHAIICQSHRQRDDQGRIIATLEDYEIVRSLVLPIISDGVQATIKETIRETVKTVEALAGADGSATIKEIAAELEIDKSSAWRRVRESIFAGYVENLETRRGRPAKLIIGETLPDEIILLPEKNFLSIRGANTTATAQPLEVSAGENSQERLHTPMQPLNNHAQDSASTDSRLQDGCTPLCNHTTADNSSSSTKSSERLHGCADIPGVDTEKNSFADIRQNIENQIDSYWQGRTWPIIPDNLLSAINDLRNQLNSAAANDSITEDKFKSLAADYLSANTQGIDKEVRPFTI